jgi:3-deoxy-D-manno-octulosonate 8-phosphate phosphatase (KDO 8-P phosphatase)
VVTSGGAPFPGVAALDLDEAARRAKRVRVVLADCDGVLTDTGVYYSDAGEAMKRFSIRDGMGVERLRNAGVAAAIVTGERSLSVQHRATKLGIRAYLGVKDKAGALDEILRDQGADLESVGYIGDDVNDLPAMRRISESGLIGVPGDGLRDVRAAAHYVTQATGGHGAFREFADWILALRLG